MNKNLTRLAAILWIVQIFSYAIGFNAFTQPLLEGDALGNIADNRSTYVTGTLMQFIAGPCFLAYTVILLPYFKKVNLWLSNWYFGFRIVEFAVINIIVVLLLILLSLSAQYGDDASGVQAIRETLTWGLEWSNTILILGFAFNCIAFSFLMSWSKIVPSWITVGWFVVTAIALFGQVAKLYGTDFEDAVILPIVVWELVTAIWLFIKGVNTSHLE